MRSVRSTRAASTDALLESGRRRLGGFLRHGITALEAKSGFGLELATEGRLLQVAARLAEETPPRLGTTLFGGHVAPEGRDAQGYVRELTHVLNPPLRPLGRFCA